MVSFFSCCRGGAWERVYSEQTFGVQQACPPGHSTMLTTKQYLKHFSLGINNELIQNGYKKILGGLRSLRLKKWVFKKERFIVSWKTDSSRLPVRTRTGPVGSHSLRTQKLNTGLGNGCSQKLTQPTPLMSFICINYRSEMSSKTIQRDDQLAFILVLVEAHVLSLNCCQQWCALPGT